MMTKWAENPLRHLLPQTNEPAWTQLLACLIEADQEIGKQVLGLTLDEDIVALRESRRVDLVVAAASNPKLPIAAVEAKLYDAFQDNQLGNYEKKLTDQGAALSSMPLVVVAPECVIPEEGELTRAGASPGTWQRRAWKDMVAPFRASTNTWVSQTAELWVEWMEQHRSAIQFVAESEWRAGSGEFGKAVSLRRIRALRKLIDASNHNGRVIWTDKNKGAGSWNVTYVVPIAGLPCQDGSLDWSYSVRVDVGEATPPHQLDGLAANATPLLHISLMREVGVKTPGSAFKGFNRRALQKFAATVERREKTVAEKLGLKRRDGPNASQIAPAFKKRPQPPRWACGGYKDVKGPRNACWFGPRYELAGDRTFADVVKAWEELVGLADDIAETLRAS